MIKTIADGIASHLIQLGYHVIKLPSYDGLAQYEGASIAVFIVTTSTTNWVADVVFNSDHAAIISFKHEDLTRSMKVEYYNPNFIEVIQNALAGLHVKY